MIVARTHTQTGHSTLVPSKVAYEAVVVHAEVAYAIVYLCRGIDYVGAIVCEPGQSIAIFLTLQLFGMCAGLDIVELYGIIGACENAELARGVKVDGCMRCW